MTTTTTPPGVRSLGVREALLAAAAARRRADRADAELLALAVHLVDLHPVGPDLPVATWDPAVLPGPDTECVGLIAGVGTPVVAERAVEELGAALGVSYRSALGLVADALELCFRLPRLWALVQAGRLQAWRARRVAQHTRLLSMAAVSFVDRHAAVLGVRNRVPGNVPALVHEALAQCDPEMALGREESALTHREVVFDYSEGDCTATARLTATLDTLDALDLEASVTHLAATMRRLGDDNSLGVRRAHALGLLARPQRALDLFAPAPEGDPVMLPATTATIRCHVTADDLRAHAAGATRTGRVEGLGAATLDLLQVWLGRLDRVSVRPVLDLGRRDGVDRHDPPQWMREVVHERDGHCVFPGCAVAARLCDLDHIEPFVPVDEGGPPGQTSPDNLACLCRRHHRLKTFTGWQYHRFGDGYRWSTPLGLTYLSRPGPTA